MKNNLIIGFICLACIQIAAPISMIAGREAILKNGEQFRFKTKPVDPYDAFRGRYVALSVKESVFKLPKGLDKREITRGSDVYAIISLDNQGYAVFSELAKARPKSGAYIKTKVRYVAGGDAYLDLPIGRYYMEEKRAPQAEQLYREHSRRQAEDAYVVVRVKDGDVAIESLYVGGKRIEDALKDSGK